MSLLCSACLIASRADWWNSCASLLTIFCFSFCIVTAIKSIAIIVRMAAMMKDLIKLNLEVPCVWSTGWLLVCPFVCFRLSLSCLALCSMGVAGDDDDDDGGCCSCGWCCGWRWSSSFRREPSDDGASSSSGIASNMLLSSCWPEGRTSLWITTINSSVFMRSLVMSVAVSLFVCMHMIINL